MWTPDHDTLVELFEHSIPFQSLGTNTVLLACSQRSCLSHNVSSHDETGLGLFMPVNENHKTKIF